MAEEHLGQRQDRQWLWTKIFSAFRLALDAKKLVLAAIGILITALGWLGLAYLFYASRTMPQWKDYDHAGASEEQRQQQFQAFKGARAHWNLLHELAGPQYPQKLEQPADVAQSLDVYEALEDIYQANHRLAAIVKVHEKDKAYVLELAVPEDATYKVTPYKVTPLDDAEKLKGRSFNLAELQLENGKDGNIVRLDNAPFRVDQNFEDLRKFREGAESRKQLQDKIDRMDKPAQRKAYEEALALYTAWTARPELLRIKPAGRMRVLPWFEDRGPNPYLMIADVVKRAGGAAETTQPWRRGDYVRWLFADEIPVLLEPLFKFLTPVVYFFDRRAGVWEHLYLALVLLFTLAVWGFFGGAITRIAAVQFARGERITLRDALGFARDRWLSFFAAPIFPLFFLILMTIALIIFGFVELIPIFGDIFIAGLLWPIVLLTGFIMAIVLVGLVGWPLMYATISTEASDSFDALSRSYSYVYQAPWHYLWYSVVACVYGAAVVFFVTFMASLLVFLGKWGVAQTPGMAHFNREPSYFFAYAPTSFGWRDLLIHDNPGAAAQETIDSAGLRVTHYGFTPEYRDALTWYNRTGAVLVSIWIYLFFLLTLGFSYSFFWSAGTVIYFLMRRQVDDTDLDEVHLEGEGLDEPFTKPVPPAPAAPATKPGAVSLNMVEAPPAGVVAPPPVATTTAPPVPTPSAQVITAPAHEPPAEPALHTPRDGESAPPLNNPLP
jgi:hypothetical protein